MNKFDNIDLLTISNGKYDIGEYISDGAFSHVYHCKIKNKQTNLIVKIQPNDDYVENAINELNILNKIKKHTGEYIAKYDSSNLIKFVEYYLDNEYVYSIFEKCDMDLNMFNILFQQIFKSRIPLFITEYIIKSCINGLNELNFNNIIHCDIKPDNILIKFCQSIKIEKTNYHMKTFEDFIKLFKLFTLKKNNITNANILSCFEIKIIDFNKSQFINQIYKSTDIQIMYYQAPEVVFGNRNFNESVDMWSIGCIIYELITGHILFDIYNKNITYGKFHELANDNNDETDSESTNLTSMYTSSKTTNNTNQLENYIYILIVTSLLGQLPNNIIGEHVDMYIQNNIILGGVEIKNKQIINIFANEEVNFKFDNNFKTDIKLVTTLIENIFTYDIKKRLTPTNCII